MKQFEVIQNTLPEDVALKIVSMLSVRDLCALGCCSRFWRELCGSDCIWESLTRERWPSLVCFDFSASSSSSAPPNAPNFKEWRKLYIEKHNEVAVRAAAAAKFVEESSPSKSLEVGDYLKAISILDDMKLGFKDVQMCLFRPNLKVLVNLVGLHYCLTWLRIPVQSYFRLFIYKEMASQVMQLHITCCVLCLSLQVCFLRSFQKKLNLRGLVLRDFSSLLSAFLFCLEIHSSSLMVLYLNISSKKVESQSILYLAVLFLSFALLKNVSR
ncbi:uncharacterized protein LOC129297425 isoform X1 [Prosopis cineraria]|uniref:uncharacterized protein LOC129297425 isoform X1 n=1 Tax=Prosopis cineraria TaxID=364024 RepID=UPI00240F4848|nr:uncharacterized protein LOC129297425 isoform X1 [Prosopis cineraria]